MSAVVVRYTTKPECAEENQRLIEDVFAELAALPAVGLTYTSIRLEDGVSFVHVAIEDDAVADRTDLVSLPAFRRFTKDIGQRCIEGPTPSNGMVIGAVGIAAAPVARA